jgi:hypothetical protein
MIIMMLNAALLSPYFWAFISVMSYIIGSLGAHWFGASQLVSGASNWSTSGGYNGSEFFGLVLHTYFIPFSLISFMIAVPLIAKNPNIIMRRVELSVVLIALITAAIIAWKHSAYMILECGIVFCFYKDSDDDGYESYSFEPFQIIYNTMSFFLCLFLIIITLPLLFTFLKPVRSVLGGGSCSLFGAGGEGGTMVEGGEDAPLLGGGNTDKNGDGGSWYKYKLGTSRKQHVYLFLVFAFYFPLLLFFASLLPDLWLYFNLSGKN